MGDVVTYECLTANSNPPATVQWIVDNRYNKVVPFVTDTTQNKLECLSLKIFIVYSQLRQELT